MNHLLKWGRRRQLRRDGFAFRYTTGPFLLPEGSGPLHWTILNNDQVIQRVRVTIFRCAVGAAKIQAARPSEVNIDPGGISYNAASPGGGFAYEVQVECNSGQILPYVSVLPSKGGESAPGTIINSSAFIRLTPR
jgi:hypothetical protein